jgi:hypothetical protein
VGKAAYKLQLPEEAKIHNVFHVSQLKPFSPNHSPVFQELPKLVDLLGVCLLPKKILERRLVKKGSHVVPQVLIKWEGMDADTAMWEDFYVLKERLPEAGVWGKTPSEAGGGVTTATDAKQEA